MALFCGVIIAAWRHFCFYIRRLRNWFGNIHVVDNCAGIIIFLSDGLFLALFFASYAWFAGRALAATIKLQGKFKVDVPISAPDQRTD